MSACFATDLSRFVARPHEGSQHEGRSTTVHVSYVKPEDSANRDDLRCCVICALESCPTDPTHVTPPLIIENRPHHEA